MTQSIPQPEVFAFLLGEGPLEGTHFGDKHPTHQGNFWWRKHLRAALAAQPLVGVIPPGMALVPIEPTSNMLAAMSGEWHHSQHGKARKQYALAIAAAPAPQAVQQDRGEAAILKVVIEESEAGVRSVGIKDENWDHLPPGIYPLVLAYWTPADFEKLDKLTAELLEPASPSGGDAAAQGAAREPLTLREIAEATTRHAHVRSDYVIEIARAIEAAHGIGTPTQGVDHG